MNSRTLAVLLLAATVLVAGCLNNNQDTSEDDEPDLRFTQTDGLSVEFLSTAPEYPEDASATFQVNVQNTGQGEATLTGIELTRAAWIDSPEVFSGSETLSGVDRSAGVAGDRQTYTKTIDLSGKFDLDQGQEPPYTVGADVQYDYGTDSRSEVTIYDQETFRDEQPSQESIATETSAGPIEVQIDGRTPISAGTDTVPITFVISNVGSGEVVDEQVQLDTIGTEAGDTSIQDCSPASEGSSIELRNGEAEIFCNLNLGSFDDDVMDIVIVTDLSYSYEVSKETQVTILGRE